MKAKVVPLEISLANASCRRPLKQSVKLSYLYSQGIFLPGKVHSEIPEISG